MPEPVTLSVDVTDAAGLGTAAHTVVTVHLPDVEDMGDPPVVCFGFPGGGYGRGYYAFDPPGSTGGGQAGWHTARGWVFVSCDHLGVGDSTVPVPDVLDYESIAAANDATVTAVMARLSAGDLLDGYPALPSAIKVGMGQSMGGCFTLVLQARHRPFDAIAILGYSAIHTEVPSRPGSDVVAMPWIPRDSDLVAPLILNQNRLMQAAAVSADSDASPAAHPWAWAFHYDDEPADIVALDMAAEEPLPAWRSATIPACAIKMVAPGTVATEAAAIDVPILVAVGERDVVADAWMEPKAYPSASDITVFVCPRMAHMHNFATSRERLWARLHSWGAGVVQSSRLSAENDGVSG